MKKILFILLLWLPLVAICQISVSSSDMPDIGDTFRLSVINGPDSFDLNNTGSNWNWDYSFLQFDDQKVDTFVNTLFTDPQYYVNFNNFFDQAHFASYAQPILPPPAFDQNFKVEDVYYYYKESSTQFSQVGFGAKLNGISISQQYNPVDVIYEFPLNFGNTSTSTSSFNYDFPNNDDYYGRTTVRNNTVDGWGPLTTPFGTFQSLRVKSELIITDTFYSDTFNIGFSLPRPTQYEYKWIAKNEGIPVLQINAQKAGNNEVINGIVYRDSVRMDIVGTKNIFVADINFKIFPNPNDGKLQISFNGKKLESENIYIRNIFGEIIFTSHISYLTSHISFDFPNGIYFLQVGSQIQKLIINH